MQPINNVVIPTNSTFIYAIRDTGAPPQPATTNTKLVDVLYLALALVVLVWPHLTRSWAFVFISTVAISSLGRLLQDIFPLVALSILVLATLNPSVTINVDGKPVKVSPRGVFAAFCQTSQVLATRRVCSEALTAVLKPLWTSFCLSQPELATSVLDFIFGASLQAKVHSEKEAHNRTRDALRAERAAHDATKAALEDEKTAHRDTKYRLRERKTILKATKNELETFRVQLDQAHIDLKGTVAFVEAQTSDMREQMRVVAAMREERDLAVEQRDAAASERNTTMEVLRERDLELRATRKSEATTKVSLPGVPTSLCTDFISD